MINLSNSLSLLRGPLAFLFLIENASIRLLAVILAMITDSIDGYLARRSKSTSRFGAALDPFMDKFFVYFVLSVFLFEGRLNLWQLFLMMSRDASLLLFAIYLIAKGSWKTCRFQSVRWGKITTVMQFAVILSLILNIPLPMFSYWMFVIVGIFVLAELLAVSKRPA